MIYFAILIPHIIIAIAIAPLAYVTLRRAFGGRFQKHRQIARITVPLWIYTAVYGLGGVPHAVPRLAQQPRVERCVARVQLAVDAFFLCVLRACM